MKASDALKLSMEKFMVEVSRAIAPKPWKHDLHWTDQVYKCCRCHRDFSIITGLKPFPCAVPPNLTEAPEVIARQLRDQCDKSKLKQAVSLLCPDEYAELADGDNWFAYNATPQEQIVCCFVALGLMEI